MENIKFGKFSAFTRAISLSIFLSATLVSCGKNAEMLPVKLADTAGTFAGCKAFEDEFWSGLHRFPLEKKPFPEASEIKPVFEQSIAEGRLKNLSASEQAKVTAILVELYELLALEALVSLGVEQTDFDKVLETLTGLELGDRTTPSKEALQTKIRAKFADVEKIAKGAGASVNCPSEKVSLPELSQQSGTMFAKWKAERHPAVYGALKALATTYQTCSAGTKPSMTEATPNVQGVSVIGRHPNGVGLQRVVSDAGALVSSHYYLRNYVKPKEQCFGVTENPLIYDYGGKPYTTADLESPLNFFLNAGTGTSALGIDCSGYIYSALASGGLKVRQYGRLKAISVSGINAKMYKNPEENGLDCLEKVKFVGSKSIRPGDILASNGHVLMVIYVGANPLGIDGITKESDCNSTNIKPSGFNFTVLQSSPFKGGMGVGRMWAKDYFTGGDMTTAMVTHAINACKARVRNTTITTLASGANLVRHKGTAACIDRELALSNQSCVSSCPAP